ncbi:hypothetical protein [Romboutsia sp.]|uniref:hypothetical protein n=1 Tax=Romboutsia sp. TaxID=1965302 RepID=UPI002B582969|nr:hypothetical protein [Romboutsia sp.]HSQ90008.1 hypothetical protein [Romboutsia sp.]
MNEPIISVEEMINYIYEKCKENGYSIPRETIEVILDYEEEFLDSKGLIELEDDEDIY